MVEVISFGELLLKPIPKISYLVDEIIPKAGLVYCFGAPGCFKTNLMLYIALKGCEGKPVFEFGVKEKFKTLWIDEENREIGMNDKISKIINGMEISNMADIENAKLTMSNNFIILGEKSLEELKKCLIEHKPDLVVIDSIAKVFPLSERDEKDVRRIYSALSPLIKEFGVTFVLIHHARKKSFQQGGRDMEDISGSREFAAMADSMLLLEEMRFGSFMLKQVKNRYSGKTYAINFDVSGDDEAIYVDYTGVVKDKYTDKMNKCKEEIMKWAESKGIKEFKRKEALDVMKEVGYKQSNIDAALKSLKYDEKGTGDYGVYRIGENTKISEETGENSNFFLDRIKKSREGKIGRREVKTGKILDNNEKGGSF